MKRVPLESVLIALESGARPKGGVTADSGEVPSLGGEHLSGEGGFDFSSIKRIPRQFFKSMRGGHIACGDVLVVKDGATTGKTSFVREGFPFAEAAVNEHVFRLQVDATKAHSAYVFHYLFSAQGQKAIQLDFRGATIGGISRRFASKVMLPLPPLPEQARVAEILERAVAVRAIRRDVITQLAQLAAAIFNDCFGEPSANPLSFSKQPLGRLIKLRSGQFLPASGMSPGGTYPVLGGNGVNGYHDEYMFDEAMVVIGRVGVYCGCVHISPPKCWVTDNALYVSECADTIEQCYLAHALMQANLNKYASQSGQPLVSGSRIYPVEILVPPMALQRDFANRIAIVERLREAHRSSLAKLDELLATLQYLAFRGEL